MNPYILLGGIGGAVAALIAVFFFGYHQGGLSAKLTADNAHVIQLTALGDAYQRQALEKQTKEAAHEQEIIKLQAGIVTNPTMVLRLCPSAPAAVVSASGQSGPDVPAAHGVGAGDAGAVPQSQGPDYGPILFGLADKFDSIVAKCRAQ